MRIALWSLALIAVTIAISLLLAHLYGTRLPEAHVAEGERSIPATVEQIAERIFNVEDHPRWRRSVDAIEIQSRADDHVRYRERSGGDAIDYLLRRGASRNELESEIVSTDLPFGGRWRFTLASQGDGVTLVRIREEGFVRPPLFRALAEVVFGHETTLKRYLSDLAVSFESTLEESQSPR